MKKILIISAGFYKEYEAMLLQGALSELEKAGRVADYIELGELMCRDALTREESCGGHFRSEYQVDGEAKRDDEKFCHAAAWEWNGSADKTQTRHQEELTFDNVHLATRSYK